MHMVPRDGAGLYALCTMLLVISLLYPCHSFIRDFWRASPGMAVSSSERESAFDQGLAVHGWKREPRRPLKIWAGCQCCLEKRVMTADDATGRSCFLFSISSYHLTYTHSPVESSFADSGAMVNRILVSWLFVFNSGVLYPYKVKLQTLELSLLQNSSSFNWESFSEIIQDLKRLAHSKIALTSPILWQKSTQTDILRNHTPTPTHDIHQRGKVLCSMMERLHHKASEFYFSYHFMCEREKCHQPIEWLAEGHGVQMVNRTFYLGLNSQSCTLVSWRTDGI